MYNSYKSYGVWEGVREDPGGGWEFGRQLRVRDLKGAGGLGGIRGFRKGIGVWKGVGSRKGAWSLRWGVGVSEGAGGQGGELRRGSSLSKVHNMFTIIQNNFSFTHKKYSCVLDKYH